MSVGLWMSSARFAVMMRSSTRPAGRDPADPQAPPTVERVDVDDVGWRLRAQRGQLVAGEPQVAVDAVLEDEEPVAPHEVEQPPAARRDEVPAGGVCRRGCTANALISCRATRAASASTLSPSSSTSTATIRAVRRLLHRPDHGRKLGSSQATTSPGRKIARHASVRPWAAQVVITMSFGSSGAPRVALSR